MAFGQKSLRIQSALGRRYGTFQKGKNVTLVRKSSLNRSSIYIHPKSFADYLSHQQSYCLFIDIDGTLADFTLNPKDSVIPEPTLILLKKIQSHGIKIAIVTGRSLTEARQMLLPVKVPIAATHGLEIGFDGDGDNNDSNIGAVDIIELAAIRQVIIQSCRPYKGFTVENKPYSVALHFRQNPALAKVAYTIMAQTLNNYNNWDLKPGKYVWEMVPKGINKGNAIFSLLKKMQISNHIFPIFIGDDITDEAAFMAVQGENKSIENPHFLARGMGIKVGSEPTCAHYYVNNIHEVTVLLNSFLRFHQTHTTLPSNLINASFSLAKNN